MLRGIFAVFAVFGGLAVLVLPPRATLKTACWGRCAFVSKAGWRAMLVLFLEFVCGFFLASYFCLYVTSEYHAHFGRLPSSFEEHRELICFMIGLGVGLLLVVVPELVWAVFSWVMVINIALTALIPCSSVECYAGRVSGTLLVAIFVSGCLVYWFIRRMSQILTASTPYVVPTTTLILASASAYLGEDYFFDDGVTMVYLLIPILGLAVTRFVWTWMVHHLACFGAIDEFWKELEELRQEDEEELEDMRRERREARRTRRRRRVDVEEEEEKDSAEA